MSLFIGKFKLVRNDSDNFDDYLREKGVSFVIRTLYKTSTPVIEITQEGDEWTIATITAFKTTKIKFKLGEELDEVSENGQKVKSTITQEDDNVLKHIWQDLYNTKITREFSEKEMKVTFEAKSVVSTRIFERV